MKTPVICIVAAVILSGCGPGTEQADTEMDVITLELVDSIGVEMGDTDYVFGAILGLEFMPGGGFAVLDRAACNVRLYDEEGNIQSRVGRPGSGPGEVVQPYGLFVWSNGDIGIMDPFQGGLLRYSGNGEYLGLEMECTHNIPFNPRMVGDTAYVAYRTLQHIDTDQPTMEAFLGRFPMTWEPSYKFVSLEVPLDPSHMADFFKEVFFYSFWAIDPVNGIVYAAPFDQGKYRIMAFPVQGGEPGIIEMETEPIPKTEEELQLERSFIAQYLTLAEGGHPGYDVNVDPWPYRLPIAGMEVDDSGNLWVLRGDREDVYFNVWNTRGEWILDCLLPDFERNDLRFRIRGNRMLLYEENPIDYQVIYFIHIPSDRPGG